MPASGRRHREPAADSAWVGGLQQRRYTYDSLGQLIGIQTPTEANAYQYDNRQRLIGQTHASAQGEHQRRWRLDPAGNRLPAKAAFQHLGAKTAASADWSAQVQQNLHDPQFNLLQPDQNPDTPAGQNIERWRDNRIGWSQDADNQDATHYRYDCWGNRRQALHIDGSITELHYDSLHQLRQAVQRNPQGQELSRTTYRYDAFGRRVSKTHRKTGEQGQITHFGWDGDRLVHTETAEQIHHTVYEPGSFVPLLQVQRSKENAGQTDPVKTLLGQGNSDASNALERELPREERELLHQALKEALQPGYQLSGLLPQELQAHVRESIQALKDAQAQTQEEHPLTIRHVLTDHLGTPIALVNANGEQLGQVAWVARYTSWGEIADEYNPDQIHQPIRFQGQQLDEETNLHYNRFRYYDPRVGQYITQDPIGLEGGINKVLYVDASPANSVDAMGLAPGDRYSSQHAAAKAAINGVNPSSIKRNQEFGGMICRDEKGRYLYTRPKDGGEDAVNPGGPGSCPKLSKATAYYHTHGGPDPRYDSENFSTADMRYADRYAIDGYVGTPAGNLKHYNYSTGKDVVIGKVKTK